MLPYNTPAPADLDKLMKGELVSPPRTRNPKISQKLINDIVMKAIAPDVHGAIPARGRPARWTCSPCARRKTTRRGPGKRRLRRRLRRSLGRCAGHPDAAAGARNARSPASAGIAASRCTRDRVCPFCGEAPVATDAKPPLSRSPTKNMAFAGTGKIWMNGTLVEWKDANIHIGSHVIHYGSGVFEGARCYDTPQGSACFRLDAHMRRLIDSAKIYRMDAALDRTAGSTPSSTRSRQRLKALLHPPADVPRLRLRLA